MLNWFSKRLREVHEKDGQKGFTLIELLVVVIIIGILAAIAIPTFLAQRDAARTSSVQSDLRNAASAAQTCASRAGDDYTADPDGTGPLTNCQSVGALEANGYNNTPGVNLTFAAGAGLNTATRVVINGVHADVTGNEDQFNYDSNRGTVAAGNQ